jgi:lysophospholipase L1-like esterase
MSDGKTILCYGDSNTWGYNPSTGDRYPRDVRWPGVLRRELGTGYWVVEAGLNGRTTVWDDPLEEGRSGKDTLLPVLRMHKPIDLVVIMLGTNDLKARYSAPACDIAAGAGVLVDMVAASDTGPGDSAPRVLLIAPPPFARLGDFSEMFEGGAAKAAGFSKHFEQVAEERGCHFLDAGQVIVSSSLDGIHLDASEHQKLGQAVAVRVEELL